MNYHTHADRIITVNILEDSTVYILKPTYISNITEVIFKPYSVNTAIARKAKIVMVNSKTPIIPPAMPTKFSILGIANKDSLFSDKVLLNSGFTDTEKALVNVGDGSWVIHRAGLQLNNLFLSSQYDTMFTATVYIQPIEVRERSIKVYNVDAQYEGVFLYTKTSMNMDFENVTLDLYRSQGGIRQIVACNYPEPVIRNLYKMTNVDIYYSQDRPNNLPLSESGFFHSGDGDLVLTDVRFKMYSETSDFAYTLAFFSFPH